MTAANWLSGLLEQAPLDLPLSLGYAARGLAPLLSGPSALEQEREFQQRVETDAAMAGATTPQERMAFALRYPEIGPMAQNVGGAGATYGVNPGRLLGLWHGVRRGEPGVRSILNEGRFSRGASAELEIPGTSLATDPNISLERFARSEPTNVLRVATDVQPREVRNLSPGEYAASGMTGLEQEVHRAVSKPQSYFAESEIFFPGSSGGQRGLLPREARPEERAALERQLATRRDMARRATDIRERAQLLHQQGSPTLRRRGMVPDLEPVLERPPTPAEFAELVRDYATSISRTGRPVAGDELRGMLELPLEARYTNAWTMMFPDDMTLLRAINDTAGTLHDAYNTQKALGSRIANRAEQVRGLSSVDRNITPDVRRMMGEQTEQYRDFARNNANFLTELQNLQLLPADRHLQRLVMRDVLRNAGNTRPFWDTIEEIYPAMEQAGVSPRNRLMLIREPEVMGLQGRRFGDLIREFERRNEILSMER